MNTPEYTAIYNRKPIYSGDTLRGLTLKITDKETGDPVIPTSVCCQIRTRVGTLLHGYTPTISAEGVVNIPPFTTTDVAQGTYYYDVQYVLQSGEVRTYLAGKIEILADISRCHT